MVVAVCISVEVTFNVALLALLSDSSAFDRGHEAMQSAMAARTTAGEGYRVPIIQCRLPADL